MSKRYRQNTIVIFLIIIPLFAFLILNNLDTVTQESLLKSLIAGSATLMVLVFSTLYSYIEIDKEMIKQRSWFFSRKEVSRDDVQTLEYDPKYEFFFMHNGYIVLKKEGSEEVVMAINPRSYKPKVISEFLSDLQKMNPDIQFDDQVKEIQAGKVLG